MWCPVAAFRLNSTPVITCYHPFILVNILRCVSLHIKRKDIIRPKELLCYFVSSEQLRWCSVGAQLVCDRPVLLLVKINRIYGIVMVCSISGMIIIELLSFRAEILYHEIQFNSISSIGISI